MQKQSQFTIQDATAAVCAAYRINGNSWVQHSYTKKTDNPDVPDTLVTANKVIALDILKNSTDTITDQDRDMAEIVLTEAKSILFKIISGQINDFEQKIATLAESETVKHFDIGILAYLPQLWANNERRRESAEKLRRASGKLPNPGSKIRTSIEVLECWYSKQWNCFYVTALTTDDNNVIPVTFSFRENLEIKSVHTITGKVKDHRNNSAKLTHVKVVK